MNLVDLGDLFAGESLEKARAARAHYRLTAATGADDSAFNAVYRLLHGYFAPKGEIERRSALEAWAAAPDREVGGMRVRYQILVATDARGALAAARDHYAVLNPASGVCVVYLAHAFVAPEHRRTGLAALLRTAPATQGRSLLADAGLDPRGAPLLLAVEQEPLSPDDPDSAVRLAAYGRAGFSAIDPAALPYCQPDFRDQAAQGLPPAPIPMLAMVRRVDLEHLPTLSSRYAAAFVTHLYTVFSTHCRPADLGSARRHALDTLARAPDPVTLLRPPPHPDEVASDSPLRRAAVLAHHTSRR